MRSRTSLTAWFALVAAGLAMVISILVAVNHNDSPTDAATIFEKVSPSVVFIQQPDGSSGSGVLLEDGWIVTNYHVTYPLEAVRVTFPDGTEIEEAPVAYWDPVSDIALLGPIESSEPTMALSDSSAVDIGSTVYLIGYPGELEDFPQPAITGGVLSRRRSVDDLGVVFLQTDALIAGGQSGGALVDARGHLIGISGLGSFTEANFALVEDAAAVALRTAALRDGDTIDETFRPPDDALTADEFEIELSSTGGPIAFYMSVPEGDDIPIPVEISASTDGPDICVSVTNGQGGPVGDLPATCFDDLDYTIERSGAAAESSGGSQDEIVYTEVDLRDFANEAGLSMEQVTGGDLLEWEFYEVEVRALVDDGVLTETQLDDFLAAQNANFLTDADSDVELVGEVDGAGMYVVSIWNVSGEPGTLEVTSNFALTPAPDSDSGSVSAGDKVMGVLDFPGDMDHFDLDTSGDDPITLRVDGLFDTFLWVLDGDGTVVAEEDDSNLGLYGTSTEMRFEPDNNGPYTVVVRSFAPEVAAGYALTVGPNLQFHK